MPTTRPLISLSVAFLLLAAIACASEDIAQPSPTKSPQVESAQPATDQPPSPAPEEQDLEIVTLLPFDAIPAVLDPTFINAAEAEAELAKLVEDPADALVLGLSINGDSRAYYIPTLSRVEIVNDTVGGQPLAVTW